MLSFRLAVVLAALTLSVPPGGAQEVPGWPHYSPPAEDPYAAGPYGPGPYPQPTPLPPPPPAVPVDGGLALLALAGAGYAARRLGRAKG